MAIFLKKRQNCWHFFLKKCQVFGNFLTVKWQFSGGSDAYSPDQHVKMLAVYVIYHDICKILLTILIVQKNLGKILDSAC